MSYRFMMRSATAAVLTTRNEVLLDGEFCFETDTGLFKLGDGVTAWNALGYWSLTPFFPAAATFGESADPSVPPANQMRLYAQNIAGRMMPKVMGPSGLDNPLQSGLQANYTSWLMPGSTTAMSLSGPAVTVVGTMSHPVMETGFTLRRSMRRASIVSAATANSASELRQAVHECYRGEAFGSAISGGFFFATRFACASATALQRVWVGLANSTAAFATTQAPSALINAIGAGWDSADTTLQIMHNDAAGVATKISLGASFPANDINAVYELVLFCPPNGAAVGYRVRRLDTGVTAQGTLATDLPAATTLLCYHAYMNNGGTAAAVTLDLMRKYLETDY
jgi:hypothetical protein